MSNKEIKEEIKKPFRTILDPPKITSTPAGSKIEEVLAMKINEKGEEEFYIDHKTNVYEKIQAFKEECEIENILARCIETGDYSALERAQGSYMDISEMPNNIFEAHQKIKEAEETFNQLPLEIRSKYDNNFNKYLLDFGSENWMKNMMIEEPKKETETYEKEKVENES